MPEKKPKLAKRINPRIRNVSIGIRNLRNIKVYPLSMHDQKQLIALVNKILKTLFEEEKKTEKTDDKNLVFISHVVKVIEDNIEELLGYAAPDEDITKFMKDIDNDQLSEIVGHVYRDNFGTPVKNVTSLFDPEQLQSVLKRQSSQSAVNMGILSDTSSIEASKKAD